MKSSIFFKIMVPVAVLALATVAFPSGNAHKAGFHISDPAQVNGTALPAGDYTARWEGTGPEVQVAIIRDGKTLATVPAKVVELQAKASDTTCETQPGGNGRRELVSLQFSGKKESLEFGGTSARAGVPTGDSNK